MKDSLSALAYFAGWRLVRTLPERSAYRLFSFIGRRAVKANGKSVQRLLPHSGNWDHAGAYFCSIGIPLVTVAERLKPEALFQRFLEYRNSMGFEVLSLDSRSFVTLMKRAREKRLIALVADRDLSRAGVDVDFFGYPSRMPAGPALLAVKT